MNSTSRRPSQLEQLARRTRKAVIIISHTMRTIHEIYPFNLFHRIEKKGEKNVPILHKNSQAEGTERWEAVVNFQEFTGARREGWFSPMVMVATSRKKEKKRKNSKL